MSKKLATYQEVSKIVYHGLKKIIVENDLDMDQVIDQFSYFLAERAMNSNNPMVNGNNMIHSITRYLMALELDRQNDFSLPKKEDHLT